MSHALQDAGMRDLMSVGTPWKRTESPYGPD